ncbi:heterokaryon incompatibility protein [Dothidotthia symphoricarpi CBS 119687]|uniref:Heterokaryon incompatibility protein n=1 Tax=Dothidotthia symphoricarpi CBS 119687 TaxID=1392245 RepID=A0A6A6AM90_9PLEO|nr:heterokaryon incompatibility protein [Dothidotthia symphoricarpi CBS 119687]KAF2132910.1 heterokaryon incompatibility protein [Dothidotthia symphoricarpi CBS 119687]
MAQETGFSTTYKYEPLQTGRHIRLLEITGSTEAGRYGTSQTTYQLIHAELPSDDTPLQFEAVSYTWGDATQVSGLQFEGVPGHIGLTSNLTHALPHLARHSATKRLWIDQICINQSDNDEKSAQVGLMSEIYKKATRTIIWLGPSDEGSELCREWLDAINHFFSTSDNCRRMTPSNLDYNTDRRNAGLQRELSDADADPKYARAIGRFWSRMWFRRGWIVQEFLLPREIVCLMGDLQFGLQDLVDLNNVPENAVKAAGGSMSYKTLMRLKIYPFKEAQPLQFLRFMANLAREFITKELGDQLYAFLGLMEGLDFVPDYNTPVKKNFTRLAVAMARDFGSLDFLSLWSASLDDLLDSTPKELKGFPSWVPSFSATPLSAPWRLAVGGARTARYEVAWNASAGRPHVYEQTLEAGQLLVRGQIIDAIDSISSEAKITRYWDVDEAYLTSLVEQIKKDLSGFDDWTYFDLVQFLNVVSSNGTEPQDATEKLLGVALDMISDLMRNSLALCLVMGTGRRFARTEKGRVGLVPFIGSQARSADRRGSVIAVLHGCSVPVVLHPVEQSVDGKLSKYRLAGDCYIEGVMHGKAVDWKESEAKTFVLV